MNSASVTGRSMPWSSGWMRSAMGWRDMALAAVLCGLGEIELFGSEQYNGKPVWPGETWVNAILILALTAPFGWRRRRPLAASLISLTVLTGSTLALGGSEAATTFIVLIAASFSGAAYSRHLFIVIAAGILTSIAHGVNDPSSEGLADLTWTYGLVAISVLLGRAVWVRQHRIGSLEADAEAARARHVLEIAAATAAERASIAREVHDIVSHAVSVVIIQAQVGGRALPGNPGVAAQSLGAIEACARTAMSELRHLLTLLGADSEPAAVAPVASLRQIDELIDSCRAAGLSVTAEIDASAVALPPVADLAAYRVVQEALTNTMRHAPGASASIRIAQCGDLLEVHAEDDGGPPRSTTPAASTGRGLIGMRERLSLAGGQLVTADHGATGFRVHAVLPAQLPAAQHSAPRGQDTVAGTP